jgi:hypothetical protein
LRKWEFAAGPAGIIDHGGSHVHGVRTGTDWNFGHTDEIGKSDLPKKFTDIWTVQKDSMRVSFAYIRRTARTRPRIHGDRSVAAIDTPIITISGKPDIVICTDGEINVISHGVASKLMLVTAEGQGRIVHRSGDRAETTIAEGGTIQMAKAFAALAADLSRSPAKSHVGTAKLGAWVIAASVVWAVSLVTMSNHVGKVSQPEMQFLPGMSSPPDAAKLGQVLEELNARKAKLAAQRAGAAQVEEQKAEVAAPRNETFAIPAELPPLSPDADDKHSALPVQAERPAVAANVPAAAPATAKTPPVIAGEAKASKGGMTVNQIAEAITAPPAKAAEPSKSAEPAKTAPKVDDAAVTAAMEEPFPEVNQNAINVAIRKMVDRGMTTDEALKLLTNLQDIGAKGEKVTPDMLAGLPHEVAQVLFESGVISKLDEEKADNPGGVPYRIIRLPESVMDSYRGKDGISNIPERNSWASTGNFVSLPLPGGGDIKTPETMKEFGLKP